MVKKEAKIPQTIRWEKEVLDHYKKLANIRNISFGLLINEVLMNAINNGK